MKILIVDNSFIVRQGLKSFLNDHFQGVVFGEAGGGPEAVERGLNEDWDVALLDVSMPGREGLDVLKEFTANKPKMPVVVLSMHEEEHVAIRVLRMGACGFIGKAGDGQELVKSIEAVVRGCRYISPSIVEKLLLLVASDRRADEALAERKREICHFIAAGKMTKEVQDELSLSVRTVKTDRAPIDS